MILNMVGGGGAGLNFTVVGGTTKPSNPSVNTIWVNTSTSITSWIFCVTQPTGSAGMVWFKVGTSSTAQFNALKKNNLQVYPLSAKQYVSGAWVNKTAKIYKNGAWVDLFTGVLNNGEFVVSTETHLVKTSARSETQGDGYIEFSATSTGGKYNTGVRGRRTASPINLTNINTIYAKVNVSSGKSATNKAGATLAILTGTDQSTKVSVVEQCTTGDRLMALDVSKYSGNHYIMFGAFAYIESSGTETGTVRFYDVYW